MQITLMTFAADELERVLHNISMPLLHSEASFVSLAYLFLKPPPPPLSRSEVLRVGKEGPY